MNATPIGLKPKLFFLALALFALSPLHADEAAAIAALTAKGVEINKSADGKATRLMVKDGKSLSAADFALIGQLTTLEQMGINGAALADSEWGFLKSLPKLKTLSIWHGHGFSTLEPFSGLPVESLTVGGCMGLRDKNRDDPEKLRHAIKTLHDLPNLKKGNWYHSPLIPDDSHLAHIAAQFPKLEDLRLDFAAPRGSKTTITPAGLSALQTLPLHTLSLENAHSFTAEHFKAVAGIKTLKSLLIDARKQAVDEEALATFRAARPDVAVAMSKPGDKTPPALPKANK
ncbi:MAG: hypothetical protein IPK22_12030 [Verrucomicrobiaceae bacterium]|nr:hypothetical protein [Verrucomicrobiaceae bacterium]